MTEMELCHGKDTGSKCPMRLYSAATLQNVLSHMRAYHANEPNFCVTCGLDGCATSSRSFAGLYSHIYRNHNEYVSRRGVYTLSVNDKIHDQLISKPLKQQNDKGLDDVPQNPEGM